MHQASGDRQTEMAENSNHEKNLPETFDEIWKLYGILEKTEEPTGSDKVQGYVYHACDYCKKAILMVNKLDLFSKNEEIEEVASGEIKYILLPALMGYFLMKNTVRDRLKVVTESKDYYSDYLKMCKSYNLTKYEVQEVHETKSDSSTESHGEVRTVPPHPHPPSQADIRGMAVQRNSKIQRYKEQKEMEKKLHDLQVTVEQEHVDDEVKRDYYLTLLKRWVNICIDEIDSINGEITILEMMAQKKGDKHHEPPRKEDHKSPPLRPFIITKDLIQKQVYGLGYPGIPTMTIEEFFDKKVEEGTLHAHTGGHSMEEWAKDPEKDKLEQEKEQTEKEEKVEKDDPEELKRARDWDEYKDDHRRGWGNRQNRH